MFLKLFHILAQMEIIIFLLHSNEERGECSNLKLTTTGAQEVPGFKESLKQRD